MNIENTIKILAISLILTVSFPNSSYALSDNPIFVEISTQWCGACKMLEPTVEQLKGEYGGKVTFLKLDATNEETVLASVAIAEQYGVSEFFLNNRDAFPRIGIFCSTSATPDHNLLGALSIDSFRAILNGLALEGGVCSLSDSGSPKQADLGPGRPGEAEYEEVLGGRPDIPLLSDRPKLPVISGRPPELSFWQAGGPIPFYAYFQFWVLPECTGDINVICSNFGLEENKDEVPTFKPWNPNTTRNEKEFNGLKKG
ncbi:MAG: hypothetical protein HYR97_02895 [Candidatus Melainabacteria bacterium]|nr:hypothetical protein [Candidatus Melainabacteria bacterium]